MRMLPLLAFVFLMPAPQSTAADELCYEMRTYYASEGKLDALHGRFRDHTMKLFEKHGIKNIGYFVPTDNKDNKLVYVIAFPSRKQQPEMWKAFLNDADWKAAYKASVADGRLVSKIESVFLKATDFSPAIQPKTADKPRLFELRTYTTREGRLDALKARFRDHTVELFTKHNLTNIAYWTPEDEDKGRDNKLVYMLAHDSEDARAAGFSAFGKDPRWKKARTESVADGPILVKKGVKSELLKPTDYSPFK
ncbi:MAG: NIPSNAP family protein [Planctomycetaceae bacterium]|nr:NIPSNAP family protein [Planctomycetaceae bacterium]